MSERVTPQSVCQELERRIMNKCDFNADIYRVLEGYLARSEFQAFLHTNKHALNEYIGYRFISLTKKYSIIYNENDKFRARILSLIINPRRQLSLNISWTNITDVSALGRVHTLMLSNCQKISDVSALGRVHTLDLSFCSLITDVSALGGVHTLDLTLCSLITDVSALGGVHTLHLSHCSGVTDVSKCTHWSYLTAQVSQMLAPWAECTHWSYLTPQMSQM
jgi:hypothetical protein